MRTTWINSTRRGYLHARRSKLTPRIRPAAWPVLRWMAAQPTRNEITGDVRVYWQRYDSDAQRVRTTTLRRLVDTGLIHCRLVDPIDPYNVCWSITAEGCERARDGR